MCQRAESYRERANQIRKLAEDLQPELQEKLRQVAKEYEQWADRLEPLTVR